MDCFISVRNRMIIKNYTDTNFITGMRAFAAFSVLLIHSGGGGLRAYGEIGNNIVDFGAKGVAVFFVISGYSVATSYKTSRGYWNYLNKRFWRIAPLYYFWISIAIFFGITATYWQTQFSTSINLYNILMHLSFMSYLDYKIANTILGVEWSIPIEFFWYLLIPFCMKWMINRKQLFMSIILSYLCFKLTLNHPTVLPVSSQNSLLAMTWSPIPYALGFFLGVTAFRLRQSDYDFTKWADLILVGCLLATILAIFKLDPDSSNSYVFFSTVTFLIILCGTDSNQFYSRVFTNKVVLYLGTISYGIYLSHLPLLVLLNRYNLVTEDFMFNKLIVLSLFTVIASTVSNFFIEQPFQSLGKFLTKTTT